MGSDMTPMILIMGSDVKEIPCGESPDGLSARAVGRPSAFSFAQYLGLPVSISIQQPAGEPQTTGAQRTVSGEPTEKCE